MTIAGKLVADGWAVYATGEPTMECLIAEVKSVATTLGEIAPGRGGRLVESIVPMSRETAHAASLSSKFGLQPLPLHTDRAHWSVPCRYLVLACAERGPTPTPTFLLDSRSIRLSERENLACRSAVFAIRNGRHSFYGSIFESGRPFIRLDGGCMTALSSDGTEALEAFRAERHAKSLYRHDWAPGDIMVLDNWRVLHGRGYDMPTERGRILIRAMIR